MYRVWRLILATTAVLAYAGYVAAPVSAIPTYTTPCSNCHPPNPALTVTVRQLAADATVATYSIEVSTTPGLAGWAVFGDSGKIAYGLRSVGQFTASVGSTYTVFGVGHETNSSGSIVIHVVPAHGSTSTTATPLSALRISRPVLSRRVPLHGRKFLVSGALGRSHPVAARITVVIQKRVGGRYRASGTRIGSISAGASRYSCKMRLSRRGHYRIRIRHHDSYDLPSKSSWRAFRVA